MLTSGATTRGVGGLRGPADSIVRGVEQGERVTIARPEVGCGGGGECAGPLELPLRRQPPVVEHRLLHTITDVAALAVDDQRAAAAVPEVGPGRLGPRLPGVRVVFREEPRGLR